jgi:hypothetical protein
MEMICLMPIHSYISCIISIHCAFSLNEPYTHQYLTGVFLGRSNQSQPCHTCSMTQIITCIAGQYHRAQSCLSSGTWLASTSCCCTKEELVHLSHIQSVSTFLHVGNHPMIKRSAGGSGLPLSPHGNTHTYSTQCQNTHTHNVKMHTHAPINSVISITEAWTIGCLFINVSTWTHLSLSN